LVMVDLGNRSTLIKAPASFVEHLLSAVRSQSFSAVYAESLSVFS
jgi:hypothetical protein